MACAASLRFSSKTSTRVTISIRPNLSTTPRALNDAPMFAYFQNSVGVANVRRFEGMLAAPPAYVTPSEAGAGFAELVARLLGG